MRTRHALLVLALGILVAGCGIKKDIYVRDTRALQDQIDALESQKETLVHERRRLRDEVEAVSQEKGALSVDLRKALDRVEELRIQAEIRKARLQELRNKLQAMVAAGQLKVRTDKGRMIVEMAEKVLFDSGRSRLKPEGFEALGLLTGILRTIEGRVFQVAGHTDSAGTDEFNWKLSLDRAREVVLYMIEMGMPPERLSAAGYGKFSPVASNETPEGMAQNRRIEIVLQPNIEELLGFDDE
jgi:chemotaxis protein MotB